MSDVNDRQKVLFEQNQVSFLPWLWRAQHAMRRIHLALQDSSDQPESTGDAFPSLTEPQLELVRILEERIAQHQVQFPEPDSAQGRIE